MLFKYHECDANVNECNPILIKLLKLDLHYFWNINNSRNFRVLFKIWWLNLMIEFDDWKINDASNDDLLICRNYYEIITKFYPSHVLWSYSYIVPCYIVYSIFITFTFILNHNGITSLLPSGGSIRSPHIAVMYVASAIYTLLDVFYHLARRLSRFMQKNNYFAIARGRDHFLRSVSRPRRRVLRCPFRVR